MWLEYEMSPYRLMFRALAPSRWHYSWMLWKFKEMRQLEVDPVDVLLKG